MSGIVTIASAAVLVVIGLGLGASTTIDDFKKAFVQTPQAVGIGFASQFVFMPLIAFTLAKAFDFPDFIAVGLITVGCCPGGTTSNIFTYWSKGNVALSITMSFFSNVAALGMMPLLIFIFIKTALDVKMDIPYLEIVISILLILIPSVIGVSVRRYNKEWKIGGKFIWEIMEISATVLGVLFFLAAVVIYLVVYTELLRTAPPGLWFSAAVMEPVGAAFGYAFASSFGLGPRDCRTIAIETGVQSFALAIAMIALSFDGEERDDALLFPILYGVFYIINSIWIVSLLRWRIPLPIEVEEEEEDKEKEKEKEEDKMQMPYSGVEMTDLGTDTGSGTIVLGAVTVEEEEVSLTLA